MQGQQNSNEFVDRHKSTPQLLLKNMLGSQNQNTVNSNIINTSINNKSQMHHHRILTQQKSPIANYSAINQIPMNYYNNYQSLDKAKQGQYNCNNNNIQKLQDEYSYSSNILLQTASISSGKTPNQTGSTSLYSSIYGRFQSGAGSSNSSQHPNIHHSSNKFVLDNSLNHQQYESSQSIGKSSNNKKQQIIDIKHKMNVTQKNNYYQQYPQSQGGGGQQRQLIKIGSKRKIMSCTMQGLDTLQQNSTYNENRQQINTAASISAVKAKIQNLLNNQNNINDKKSDREIYSDDELFSTERKHKRYQNQIFLKENEQQNQNLHISKIPEKNFTKMAYLTSKMNPVYQDTVSKLNQAESSQLNIQPDSSIDFLLDQYNRDRQMLSEKQMQEKYFGKVRTVKFVNSKSQQLEDDIWNEIKLTTLDFFYVYICVKGMPAPMQIRIRSSKNDVKFKIYTSKATMYPSNFNCDEIFYTKTLKIKDDPNKKDFTYENLYMGIVSDADVDIFIKYEFNLFSNKQQPLSSFEKQQLKQQRKLKRMPSYLLIKTPDLALIVAEIKKKRRFNLMRLSMDKDIVKENINGVQSFSLENQINKLEQKSQNLQEKLVAVVEKKKQLDEQNYYKKTFEINKRNIQRNIQLALIKQEKNQQKEMLRINRMAKIIKQVNALDMVYRIFKNKISFFKKLYSFAIQIKLLIIRSMKKIEMSYGPDLTTRTLVHQGQSVMLGVNLIKKQTRKKCRAIFIDILKKNSQSYTINQKILKFYKKATFVQSQYRNFLFKQKNFRKLIGYLFDKYFLGILSQIGESDHISLGLENKERLQKFQSERTKKKFIKNFMNDRIIEYWEQQHKYKELIKSNSKKVKAMQIFIQKDQEQEDIKLLYSKDFESVKDEDEKQIRDLIFKSSHASANTQQLKSPRFFIVPKFEVLRQKIKNLYDQLRDEEQQQQQNQLSVKVMKTLNRLSQINILAHTPRLGDIQNSSNGNINNQEQ